MPDNALPASVVHIAGLDVQVGHHLRQRCGWCGATLVDQNVCPLAAPPGQDPQPGIWAVGGLVEVWDGGAWAVEHTDGDQLPDNACGALDPEVTA